MPLVVPKIKKRVEAAVLAAYKREFGELQKDNKGAASSWKKQAKVMADAVEVVVNAILLEAQVAPGIAAPGGATTGPGKIV